MRGVVLVAALSVGCWTGSEPPPVAPATPAPTRAQQPLHLRVQLERTPCLGTCPAYTVTIAGDGRVTWTGRSNVLAIGARQGRVPRHALEQLSRLIDRARFFERNQYGELPQKPECTTTGTTTTCSFSASVSICTDSPHAIVRVRRDGRTHAVDNDHCSDRPELDALEDYIDRIANTDTWIGS